jgi:hypothetical protein
MMASPEVAGYHAGNPWRVSSGEAQQIERHKFMNDQMELGVWETPDVDFHNRVFMDSK